MSSQDSVTRLIHEIRAGDSKAAEALWERYFPRLVHFARERLRDASTLVQDEEDVALSAMNRFFRAAQEGRYPNLAGRDELWCLLLRITNRRLLNLRRDASRQRRGGGRVGNILSALGRRDGTSGMAPANALDSPEFAAMMADQCRRLLEMLRDDELRMIAVAKMEGYSDAEIAARLNRSERTVERRLRLIRDRWKLDWERAKRRGC